MTNIIPAGYCHCRCGERTNPAPCNWKARGWVKDRPLKYVNGHSARVQVRKRKHADKQARQRSYYARNREALIAKAKAAVHRRRGAEGSHTPEEVASMHADQGGLCAYCEVELGGDFHVDHMTPIIRGGRNSWENLAVVCPTCNLSKRTKTAEEFFAA